MLHADGDISRLIFGEQKSLGAARHLGRTAHHYPMLGTVEMHLQSQRCAGLHHDTLHLKALARIDAFVAPPGPIDPSVREALAAIAGFEMLDEFLHGLRLTLVSHHHRVGSLHHHHVVKAHHRHQAMFGVQQAVAGRVSQHVTLRDIAVGIGYAYVPDRRPRAHVRPARRQRHHCRPQPARRLQRQLFHHGVVDGVARASGERGLVDPIEVAVAGAAAPAHRVAAFVEKPDLATAQSYVDAGDYHWNSGLFVMKASVWLKARAHYRPDIVAACRRAYEGGARDSDFYRVDKAAFTACASDSIDYAVMEKLALEPAGGWRASWDVGVADADGNVSKGDVLAYSTRNSLLYAEHRLVAVVGLDDMVVVETADAVMVAHKSQAQDVKKIVEHLKAGKRSERLTHRRVYRPWGSYEGIDAGERFQVKRIVVKPGAALSLQMHHHRAEHWIVVRGTAKVTRGTEAFLLTENQSTYIPIGVQHRLENPGTLPLEIIEAQSGAYLGEDDIVRFEDVYGRSC